MNGLNHDTPLFTIVTPVFNREDCLGRCIDSVLKQSFDSWEMIVVDDGSKDRSYGIAKQYSDADARIIALRHERNRGTNAARNLAVENAKGEYIIILDSDDYFVDDALGIIYREISKHPGYRQYMFQADDLIEYYKSNKRLALTDGVCRLSYSDWLSGEIGEDFIHVIESSIMKRYPFNEKTRILEGVNFMRFFRESENQLYIPQLITIRERGRADSVTPTALMTDVPAMERCYLANTQWLEWFAEDATARGCGSVVVGKKKLCALLALSLGKYDEFDRYSDSLPKSHRIVCGLLSALRAGSIIRNAILLKTKIKHRR